MKQALGLFDIGISTVENYICLCHKCQQAFENDINPGWTFFPKDLNYFIEFEVKDRRRRSRNPSLPRHVPTAEMYLQHMKDIGQVSEETKDSPYVFYVLCPDEMDRDVLAMIERTEKGWHGAPLAAIRRAWMALGSIRDYRIPVEYRRKLFELLELYRAPLDHLSWPSTAGSTKATTSVTHREPLPQKNSDAG